MKVDLKYDPEADAAYLRLRLQAIIESEEVAPGTILDYDAEGHSIALEVLASGDRNACCCRPGKSAGGAGREPLPGKSPMRCLRQGR